VDQGDRPLMRFFERDACPSQIFHERLDKRAFERGLCVWHTAIAVSRIEAVVQCLAEEHRCLMHSAIDAQERARERRDEWLRASKSCSRKW
jgi:hypothetical protein